MEKFSRVRPVNQGNNLFMTVGRIRLVLVLMGISLGLWIVFAKVVVPAVIVSNYLQDWDRVIMRGLLSGLGFWLIVLVISSPAFFRRMVGEVTPGALGAIRMWTCLILLLATLWEDLPSIALLPAEMRQSLGMMQYLYKLPIGFERLVTSEASLRAFQWLTELILFLGVIGWHTRFMDAALIERAENIDALGR